MHAVQFLTRDVTGSMTFYTGCRRDKSEDQYTSDIELRPYTPIQISIVRKQIKQIHERKCPPYPNTAGEAHRRKQLADPDSYSVHFSLSL